MKISEMTNDQAAEAIIRISGPMSNICDDEELVTMLDEFSKMNDLGMIRAIGRIIPKLTAYALQKHRKDFYEIIGALDGKTQAQVQKMNFKETVQLVKDSYDEILKDFFTSFAQSKKQTEGA